ncbi:MAG: NADH-quinone oxidoreductase subunit J [bacterium]|nr:NADH-quinone oxidoreductase subunit J [bacterium]
MKEIPRVDALLPSLLFYAFAGVILGSAAFTAFARDIVHAAFSLLFTFFGLACLYLYLGADFVGLSQVVIYVGGILVLLLFGVMFTGHQTQETEKRTVNFYWGLALIALLGAGMVPALLKAPWAVKSAAELPEAKSTISSIATLLMTDYLLPFEIASLLLLMALIGAVVIARGETKTDEGESPETSA